jgi:hypothetical protein
VYTTRRANEPRPITEIAFQSTGDRRRCVGRKLSTAGGIESFHGTDERQRRHLSQVVEVDPTRPKPRRDGVGERKVALDEECPQLKVPRLGIAEVQGDEITHGAVESV